MTKRAYTPPRLMPLPKSDRRVTAMLIGLSAATEVDLVTGHMVKHYDVVSAYPIATGLKDE